MRDLGNIAERTVESWAAERSIPAQPVRVDRTGWDILLELPIVMAPGPGGGPQAMDRCLAPLSCLMQVKATTAAKASRPISLRNCLRLAKNPQPVFFLILLYGKGSAPRQAYLVPLDEDWVYRILKRVRTADAMGTEIGRQTLTITATDAHRIEPDGQGLERAIRAHVGADMNDYAARKAAWNRTVGYEQTTGKLEFQVSEVHLHGVSLPEYLRDLALGVREPLRIENATLTDVRFGVPACRPLAELSQAVFDILRQPAASVEVRLRSGNSQAWQTMDLLLPAGVMAVLTPEMLRLRLVSKFLSIMVAPSGLDFAIELPALDAAEPLRDLYGLASFVTLMEQGARQGERLELSVSRDGRVLLREELRGSPRFAPRLVELTGIIRDAWTVAKHFDIHDRVEVALAALLAQQRHLSAFLALVGPPGGTIVRFWSSSKIPGRRVCLPLGVSARLGSFRVTAVSSFWGRLKPTDVGVPGEIGYEMVAPRLKAERTLVVSDDDRAPTLAEAVNEVADAYDDSVTCVIMSQYALPPAPGTGRDTASRRRASAGRDGRAKT